MFILSPADLGQLVKRARKAQGMTQSELAGACGTGVRFIVDLEKGKPSCELGKALQVVVLLGIKLQAQEPPPLESEP